MDCQKKPINLKQKDHTKEMNTLVEQIFFATPNVWRVKLGTSIWEHQFDISCSRYVIFVTTSAFLKDLSTWATILSKKQFERKMSI